MKADRVITYPADAAQRLADRLQDENWHMDGDEAGEIARDIVIDITEAVDSLRATEATTVVVLAADGAEPLVLGPFREVQIDDCTIFDVVAGRSIAEWSYGDGPDGYVVQPPYTGAMDGVYQRALIRADHVAAQEAEAAAGA